MTEPLEIERKFLIEMPERAVLDRCPTRWEIWQTYLLAPPEISARVRRRVGETEQFFHTEKLRRTDRTCVEREREITRAEYETLLRVLREVSDDWRLKNAALAGHVPPEEELLAEMEENGGFSLHEGAECGKIS